MLGDLNKPMALAGPSLAAAILLGNVITASGQKNLAENYRLKDGVLSWNQTSHSSGGNLTSIPGEHGANQEGAHQVLLTSCILSSVFQR